MRLVQRSWSWWFAAGERDQPRSVDWAFVTEAQDSTTPSTTRIRLDLAYDGAGFSGWARQPQLRTVQGELEAALATLFRRVPPAPALVVAGRTDAGVHAIGQVAHLDLTAEQMQHLHRLGSSRGHASAENPATVLVRKLNGLAGRQRDLRVHRACIAPSGFDARFAAIWRRYEYRIADADAVHDPLDRSRTVWITDALDLAAMATASDALVGLADWATYCRPRPGTTTIRELQSFTWHRDDRGVLVARLQADAFCHSMVRALVGACVAVGTGSLDARDPLRLRAAQQRTSEFRVMPAGGLVLVEVGYPADDLLASRAELTRGHRTLGVPGVDRTDPVA
jgi:tRNA pseudouridine38-40 synthase